MKDRDKLKEVKIICERCSAQFVLKVPRITSVTSLAHPWFINLKSSGQTISLCPECQKEFDEMAPEE